MPSMKSHDLHRATCGRSAAAGCRAPFSTMLEAGSYGAGDAAAPTAPTWRGSSCASACWSTSRRREHGHDASSARTCRCRIALSTVGMSGLMHGNGEILACRAAQAQAFPTRSSTMSICSIEDVAAEVDKPFWFQLYVMKDRGFVRVADRARHRRQMQRAGADRRPAGAWPAPCRHAGTAWRCRRR